VAADWHEPMMPQRIMWRSVARANGQLNHGAANKHTIAPISHTLPSPRSRSYYSFPVPLRVGGWVGLSTQWVNNLLKVACNGPGMSRTRNLSVTSPILYHYTLQPLQLLPNADLTRAATLRTMLRCPLTQGH